jgi:HEAT repeat protein
MKTLLLYLAVMLSAAGAAWMVFRTPAQSGDQTEAEQAEAAMEAVRGSTRDPLWYRDLSPQERRASARFRILRMASSSVSPTQIGELKDEIALLCYDESVVELVVSAFEELPSRAPARTSAFMELFGRVRHPKFAELFHRAINHEEYEPRVNALEAARVQANERSLPFLSAALTTADEANQVRIVRAISAIGSAAGYDLIRRNLGRMGRDALILGVPLLAEANYREALPAIERLLDHSEVDVQVVAAYSVARLGRDIGIEKLAEHARARDRLEASRAQALQLHARIAPKSRATALDLEMLEDDADLVRTEALSGLVARGHEKGYERVQEYLDGDDPAARSRAMIALGRSGRDEDLQRARSVLGRLGPREIQIFFTSVGLGRAPGAVDLFAEIARRRGPEAKIALEAFPSLGQRALPTLAELLTAEEEESRIADIARAISAIPCDRAREILLAWSPRGSTNLRIYVRSGVRRIDQKVLAGEIAEMNRGLR